MTSPCLCTCSSKASATAVRSYASIERSSGTVSRSASNRIRFWHIICSRIVRNVSRSIAHSVAADVATTDAARGVLYMSASSPKVMPGLYSSTFLPGGSRPSSGFLTKQSKVPLSTM